VIFSLPAGSLIAFILFALIRHAEQSEERKATSLTPTASRPTPAPGRPRSGPPTP
jgi:hypothetical protein